MNDFGDATATETAHDGTTIDILCVDDDADFLELIATHLSDNDDFEVHTETDPSAVVGQVGSVDCIVSDYDMPGTDGLELLAMVRERAPTLPFVLCTGSARDDLADEVPDEVWTEFIQKGDVRVTASILANRIRRLVDHRRTFRMANRSLTAIEATGDGIAVVAPDGTISFANQVFASQLGRAADELIGEPWQTCFPDEEVDRLQSTALQTVRDDWQWTGGCRMHTDDGDIFTAQTRVAGLDDGSFVLCLTDIGDD